METRSAHALNPIYKGYPVKDLPNALEGFIDSRPIVNRDVIASNRDFPSYAAASTFVAEPPVLHFAGFETGRLHTARVRVVNQAGYAARMHVLPATAPCFKVTVPDKKGFVPPGLAEIIEVQFAPKEYRYYNEAIRIHCGDEAFSVQVHAYPITSAASIPSSIAFGLVHIGTTSSRTIPLVSDVPVAFEFAVRILQPKSDFTVAPESGVIPAHGRIDVEITFAPTAICTHRTDLEFAISQFGSEPMRCHVTGYCAPCAVRDAKVGELYSAELGGKRLESVVRGDVRKIDGITALEGALRRALSKTALGGAGHGDAFTEFTWRTRQRSLAPLEVKLPTVNPPPPDTLWKDTGICLPADFDSNASISYVLNQENGRLRIRDLKNCIADKKAELQRVDEELQVVAVSSPGGVDALDNRDVDGRVKEALFRKRLREVQTAQATVNSSFALSSGKVPPTAAEQSTYVGALQSHLAEAQALEEERACQQQATTRFACGALHLEAPVDAQRQARSDHSDPAKPSGASQAEATGDRTTHADVQPEEEAGSGGGIPAFRPTFRAEEFDDLDKRAVAWTRFARAARIVIIRARVQRRLQRIQNVLTQLDWDFEKVRNEVATPQLLSRDKMGARPGVAPSTLMNPDKVHLWPIRQRREVDFFELKPRPVAEYTDYDRMEHVSLKVPLAYKLVSYEPDSHFGFLSYVPPLLDQPLEDGALEEHDLAGARPMAALEASVDGVPYSVDKSSGLEMPAELLETPFPLVEMGTKYARTQDAVISQPSRPMTSRLDAPLQLELLAHYKAAEREALAENAIRVAAHAPLLSERWQPRRQDWRVFSPLAEPPQRLAGPDALGSFDLTWADNENPEEQLRVPTDDMIKQWLPPSKEELARQAAEDETAAVKAASGAKGSKGKAAAPAEPVQTKESDQAAAQPEPQPGDAGYKLPRQIALESMQQEHEARRAEAVAAFDGPITELNNATRMPCHFHISLGTEGEPEASEDGRNPES